jgi:small subunit ribosomal protein S17
MATPIPQRATQLNVRNSASKGRTFRGTVVSVKMQDTATVAVERYVQHPKYKKFIRRTKKYLVHDPRNTAAEGDVVTIREVRPVSKRKHFAIVNNSADKSVI